MRWRQERGIVLLNILLALSIFAVLLSTVLPAARSIYAHAAVEYEAMCLIGELRRVQAISRTTAMPLYMMERPLSSERAPQQESLYVVIDRAARIRLQRGGKDAADEEE